jgi:CRP/FNR family transcriptional regulator
MQNIYDILTGNEKKLLENSRRILGVKKGKSIFQEGKIPGGVFYLHSGKVKIFTTSKNGKEQIIHLAKPGDLMGYRALLGGDTYSASGTALENSEAWFIPKETFFSLLDTNPAFSHAIIRLLTAELRQAEHHLGGLAGKPVKARLAEAVLLLADTYGFENDGKTLAVSLSRDELAALVGTATETVIRLLNSLKKEGLLATEGKKLRLTDRNALEQEAQTA